jgi:hypothetical protein
VRVLCDVEFELYIIWDITFVSLFFILLSKNIMQVDWQNLLRTNKS